MPNGIDKNLRRLQFACASYRRRYQEWPSQARMEPVILWDIAQLLDAENFARLAAHIELRSKDHHGLSVGGRAGVLVYEGPEEEAEEELELTRRWLNVEVRRDARHD